MELLGPSDPSRIGRYRLTHLLGIGGMGKVYLAYTGSGRKVVVKVIHADYVRQAEYRTRFTREVQAARRVGGFHTAQVVDADTQANEPWIASAYIPGPSLQQSVITHGPLPEKSLRVLAAGLAEGLEGIHGHGLVHRDIKPANIILAEDGPRIIDFGVARPTEDTRITHSGALLGTPAYMAPEQAEGERPEPAVDVFSLGTVLHFAATGTNPFKARTLMATLRLLIGPTPTISDSVPEDLRTLIMRCWDLNPTKRPSVTEVIDILGEVGSDRLWPPRPHAVLVNVEVLGEHFDAFEKFYDEDMYEAALPGFEQLFPQFRRAWGDDHQRTLLLRYLIADCQGQTGHPEDALEGLRRLLPDEIRVHGPNHTKTLTTRHKIGYYLGLIGEHASALQVLQALLPDQTRILGPDDLETLATRYYLGYNLGKLGDYQAALKVLRALLPDCTRILNPDDTDVLATRYLIGFHLLDTEDHKAARETFHALLLDYTRVLGPDHVQTRNTKQALEVCQAKLAKE